MIINIIKNKLKNIKIKKTAIVFLFLLTLVISGFLFQKQIRESVSGKFIATGNYYFNGGEYDTVKAEKYFKLALRVKPDTDAAYYQLARIHLVENDLALAREEIDKSLAINPENQRAFYIRGLIDGYDKKYDDAISDFQKFVAWSPTEWAGYNDLAWAYFLNKDFKNTRKVAQEGLDNAGENNPWLLNGLGVAYVNLGEPQKAEGIFAKVKELASDLTPEKWASAYPGNDPSQADFNLKKFRIDVNSNSLLALNGFTSGGIVASACGSSTCKPSCTCNACSGEVCGSDGCGGNCYGNITGGTCNSNNNNNKPKPKPCVSTGCSCNSCAGTQCGTDNCGNACYGNTGPNCSFDNWKYCTRDSNNNLVKYNSSNGCGICTGSKTTNYVPVCLYSDAESCTQSNCGKEITTKTAYCVGISNTWDSFSNRCGPLQVTTSGCSNCNVQKTTCPPCSWREVRP